MRATIADQRTSNDTTGPGRCFPFWQEMLACYVVNTNSEDGSGKKKCAPMLEDYYECLHHRKEVQICLPTNPPPTQTQQRPNTEGNDRPLVSTPSNPHTASISPQTPETTPLQLVK